MRDSATTPPAKQWGGWGGVCDAPCIPTHQRGTGRGCWDRGVPNNLPGSGDYAQPHVPSPRRGASPTHPHQPPAPPLLPLPLPPPPAQPSSKSCHLRYRLNLTCQRHNQAAAQQRAIVRAASRVQTGGGWRCAAGTPVSGCMTASRNASGPTRRGKRPARSQHRLASDERKVDYVNCAWGGVWPGVPLRALQCTGARHAPVHGTRAWGVGITCTA